MTTPPGRAEGIESRRRIRNVLFKEWEGLFKDLNNTVLITVVPLLIVGQGLLYVWLAQNFAGPDLLASPLIQGALASLLASVPGAAALDGPERLIALLLTQMNLWLLLIPTIIAVTVATFSIVEEKLSHSLEPLLATPVRTWELLLGKALSGAIPAVIVTWICGGVLLGAIALMGWGRLVPLVVTPAWIITLLLVNPAVAILSFLLGVIGSSRARDAKSAQNRSIIIIFPVLALIAAQVTGFVWFTGPLTVALAVVLLGVDYLVLRGAVRLFQRESILVNWR